MSGSWIPVPEGLQPDFGVECTHGLGATGVWAGLNLDVEVRNVSQIVSAAWSRLVW